MCTGVWVGWALVPFAPLVFGTGILPFIVTGLLIKGIGHLILALVHWMEASRQETEYIDTDDLINAMHIERD